MLMPATADTILTPSDTPDAAILIQGLVKRYAAQGKAEAKLALKGVDLTIPKGSMFALLGPNGAGKSTLINILAGLVNKTEGQVSIWGHSLDTAMRQAKVSIGIVPQELNLDPFFTPRELLDVQAGMYGVPKKERRTLELLETVGLSDKADAYARTLSGGMRRRLMVAKAMVHSPPILVLDEPTAGVDIELRRSLWRTVRKLNAQGVTVVLTTHYLEEAEELCDTIAIINHGEVVACEAKETLLKRVDSKTMRLTLEKQHDTLPTALESLGGTLIKPDVLAVNYKPSEAAVGDILQAVCDAGLSVIDISTEEADLEDIFLQLTAPERGDVQQAPTGS